MVYYFSSSLTLFHLQHISRRASSGPQSTMYYVHERRRTGRTRTTGNYFDMQNAVHYSPRVLNFGNVALQLFCHPLPRMQCFVILYMYLLASHLNAKVERHHDHGHHNVCQRQRYNEIIREHAENVERESEQSREYKVKSVGV